MLLISILLTACVEDRTYEKSRLELATKTRQVIIENSICTGVIDCQEKQLFFLGPAKSGISIQLYGVLNEKVLVELLNAYSEKFISKNGKMKLTVKLYSITKKEDLELPFWNEASPIYQFEFK